MVDALIASEGMSERAALATAGRIWWRMALEATNRNDRDAALARVREIAEVAADEQY